jgi:hypothetical protein
LIRIDLLSEDRAQFKEAYIRNVDLYERGGGEFAVLIAISRILFFSKGYPAPHRTSVVALEYAFGVTDLYVEFMKECGLNFDELVENIEHDDDESNNLSK